jgi:hypothetical protein
MLWQTILGYWIAKILQAMLKEERERKGNVKQMLLGCSKFHGFGWKDARMTVLKLYLWLQLGS